MVRSALRGSSWAHLVDYASPALFDVIPARPLLAQSRELFSNRGNKARFSRVREQACNLFDQRGIEVELRHGPRGVLEAPLTELSASSRARIGESVLNIYFTQVFRSADALLDFRPDKFSTDEEGGLVWRPGALYVHWQPNFLEGVRGLYYGFYRKDTARFDSALQTLDMAGSGRSLRELLGRDDPRAARFDIDAFHTTFHELFVSCRERGMTLHRNFLPLGISLMCLYETLSLLDVPLDVLATVDKALEQ